MAQYYMVYHIAALGGFLSNLKLLRLNVNGLCKRVLFSIRVWGAQGTLT